MSLDEIGIVEDVDSGSSSVEISEKFKEEVRKGSAGVKRVRKDEKRAKKVDFVLAGFLAEILKNPDYDFVLDDIIRNLDGGISSNFVLGVMSLIHMPISNKIRDLSGKKYVTFSYEIAENEVEFDDENIPDDIKTRLGYLVEDIDDIVNYEPSSVITERLKEKILEPYVVDFFCKVFMEFFKSVNINVTEEKANQYVTFIITQIKANLEKIILEEI